MEKIVSILALSLLVLSPASMIALASGDAPAPAVDCRAAPADQPAGDGAILPEESKLDECGSVLAPPASADGEITVQPDQGGETPVIPPSQLPPVEDEDD